MKILFYDISPSYRMEIHDREVKVYSDTSRSKGKELAQWFTHDGYLRTKIQSKTRTIHSLVATCALGDRPEGYVVNHIDGDKLNNNPSNLEYCTIAQNIAHSVKHNLHVCHRPEDSGRYKDGRAVKGRLSLYKKEWYERNKSRLKAEGKSGWKYEKKCE